MYCMKLFPKIVGSTRITPFGTTLTDNMFKNNMENNPAVGVLINDITDYLPVFTA